MFKSELKSIIEGVRGTVGVIVKGLSTGDIFSYNEGVVFPAASVIKLSILWALFEEIEAGKLSLDDEITLSDQHRVGGFGILKELHSGLNLTIKDLATLMIILSDNVATNILIDIIGIERINESIKGIGMKKTSLQRKMMDVQAKQRGLDNFTTPEDTLIILENYINSNKLSQDSRQIMIDILKRQQCNNKLPEFLPEGWVLAHKTGDLPGVEHDVGILYTNRKTVIIIVMTKDLIDNREGIKLNNEIGRIVYSHFNQ
ncbi:Extended-spectrum beta-lactamase PER-1 [Koleobacter methoxysyntrophicus]|uniref:Extended-spectrum beta-lactamase PER-1 n=1 Tax=Koleobacter methoxysyntrophicus TaxID=2751313 RepID=A0A8A0RLH5_9FIRM|nr:serine hydrolase [Koleobacter methoxysyntrophicus]QSQ08468.1 Extended-spectrum beta-lactamase PER-1 [Koleobacter methoxysyntrophicus]